MRAWSCLRWGVGLLFALSSAGCTSHTPPPTTLPPPAPEAPRAPSHVVAQEVPPLVVRDAALVAVGTPVFQVVHDSDLMSLDISRDGSLVLVAGRSGTVSVLDFATGATRLTRRLWVGPSPGWLREVRFDPTGTRVLLQGEGPPHADGLLVWDLLTDTLVSGHARQCRDAARAEVSGDGSLVVTVDHPLTQVRDASTLVPLRTLPLAWEDGDPLIPGRLWLSPSGTRVLATLAGREVARPDDGRGTTFETGVITLQLFDAEGVLLNTILDEDDGFVAVGFRPGGGLLMTLTGAGTVQLRHPETGALLHDVALPGRDAQWSREGELLFVRHADEHTPVIHLVDPATGAVVASVEGRWPFSSARGPDGSLVVFSLTGEQAFSATGEPRAHPLAAFPEADPLDRRGLFAMTRRGERAVRVHEGVLRFLDLGAGREVARPGPTLGPESVWGGLFVPGVGVLMTNRSSGVLFRAAGATPVHCARADAQLRGTGSSARVVNGIDECGLDDAVGSDAPRPQDGAAGLVLRVSADGSTRVFAHEGGGLSVDDVRTGRVLMRIPVEDLPEPSCPTCAGTHQLSPDGALLLAYPDAPRLSVFDVPTRRRVARIESPGRRVDWARASDDGSAFWVKWQPHPLRSSDPVLPRAIVAYDRRGRVLATLEDGPERGEPGAAFSSTHGVVFFGSRALVVDIRRRTTVPLVAPFVIDDALWHGTTLRLVANSRRPRPVHMLYALGATQPHFQMKDTAAFTADARWVFRCRAGELERVHVPDEARTVFGTCVGTPLFPSDDGRYVAQPMGDHLRVVREDGVAVRLAARGTGAHLEAYSVYEPPGRYVAFNAAGGEVPLRYRQPGPATTAPLVPLSEAGSMEDPQLLQRFFRL